jgi:hypothetical protein
MPYSRSTANFSCWGTLRQLHQPQAGEDRGRDQRPVLRFGGGEQLLDLDGFEGALLLATCT